MQHSELFSFFGSTSFIMGSQARILVELVRGPKTPKEIIKNTGLAARTISFNLKTMLALKPAIISRHSSLQDARQSIYFICDPHLLSRLCRVLNIPAPQQAPVEDLVIEGSQSRTVGPVKLNT